MQRHILHIRNSYVSHTVTYRYKYAYSNVHVYTHAQTRISRWMYVRLHGCNALQAPKFTRKRCTFLTERITLVFLSVRCGMCWCRFSGFPALPSGAPFALECREGTGSGGPTVFWPRFGRCTRRLRVYGLWFSLINLQAFGLQGFPLLANNRPM